MNRQTSFVVVLLSLFVAARADVGVVEHDRRIEGLDPYFELKTVYFA